MIAKTVPVTAIWNSAAPSVIYFEADFIENILMILIKIKVFDNPPQQFRNLIYSLFPFLRNKIIPEVEWYTLVNISQTEVQMVLSAIFF